MHDENGTNKRGLSCSAILCFSIVYAIIERSCKYFRKSTCELKMKHRRRIFSQNELFIYIVSRLRETHCNSSRIYATRVYKFHWNSRWIIARSRERDHSQELIYSRNSSATYGFRNFQTICRNLLITDLCVFIRKVYIIVIFSNNLFHFSSQQRPRLSSNVEPNIIVRS